MDFINMRKRYCRSNKPLRDKLRLILPIAILNMFCSPAAAQASVAETLANIRVPGIEWQGQQIMELSGVPMHVRRFSSNNAVLSVAQALAQHSGLFERILKLNSKVVLSGLRSDSHWLAEVDASTSGSQGYVSALHIEADDGSQSGRAVRHSFIWLPPQAKRQFDHQSTMGDRKVVQQIYSVALPVRILTSYLRRQLPTAGWVPDPEFAGMGAATAWSRARERVMLFPQAGASGTSLYLHYSE